MHIYVVVDVVVVVGFIVCVEKIWSAIQHMKIKQEKKKEKKNKRKEERKSIALLLRLDTMQRKS